MIKKNLRKQFKRREWTANPADPTQVIEYKSKFLTMVHSWEVEANIHIGRRKFRFYDNRFFNWLFGLLEDNYTDEQMSYDEDPMGGPGSYI